MNAQIYNVLFLCTENSARSILAEAILNRAGAGKFRAYSAGSHPRGTVNPHALRHLRSHDFPVGALRSKSWDEFAKPEAPKLDFIITVCDNAAGEVCPVWPGKPVAAHWGVADPAEVKGSDAEIARAFAETHRLLAMRIESLVALPVAELDAATLRQRIKEIGRMEGATFPRAGE